jgi:hypothetical protein
MDPAVTTPSGSVSNPGFEAGGVATQTPPNWGTWLGASGTDADADYTQTIRAWALRLHPECHRQVHSLKLEVVKPRPEKGVWEARAD